MLFSQCNVLFMVLGTRGDVQCILKAGKLLNDRFGARVRIATHPNFQRLVEDEGLEFFNVGGDPNFIIEFWLENPSLLPTLSAFRSGRVRRIRSMFRELLQGYWAACVDQRGETTTKNDFKNTGGVTNRPFVADVIISNAPNKAHIHCAERLGVPLLLVMAQPQSPTRAFPHVHSKSSDLSFTPSLWKYFSHIRSETIIWMITLSSINSFREEDLGLLRLPRISTVLKQKSWGAPLIGLWCDIVAPKPPDWGPEIEVAGYSFMDPSKPRELDPQLQSFLLAGPPPVYIGFGSMPVRDPQRITAIIVSAVCMCGVRAIINPGRAGLGSGPSVVTSPTVYVANDIPHSVLLPHVQAMVHHGGAGTVASQLLHGVPAVIVPFIGDQRFWANRLFSLGVIPRPIPIGELTANGLAEALQKLLEPDNRYRNWTREIGFYIANHQDGAETVLDIFQTIANEGKIACHLHPELAAVWKLKDKNINLSTLAAFALVKEEKLRWEDLELLVRKEWNLVFWWAGYVEKMSQLFLLLLLLWSGMAKLPSFMRYLFIIIWLLSLGSGLGAQQNAKSLKYSVGESLIRQARINQGRYDFEMMESNSK